MFSLKLRPLTALVTCNNNPIYLSKNNYYKHPSPYVHPNPVNQPKPVRRKWSKKVADPQFKKDRARKVHKIDLPNFQEEKAKSENLTPADINKRMKELGMQPMRPWSERPIFVSCSANTVDRYVPPEGDGRAGILSKEGAKQSVEFIGKKGKSIMALRKIRSYEDDYLEMDKFCESAKGIYIDLHKTLCDVDEKKLHTLATETIYPLMINETNLRTMRWNFYGSLEPEKAVQVRYNTGINEDDIFAQITVRFHTQQTLAVYDRFGRLIHGSESVLRDILEYIVFEKQVSNEYGRWRVHDKIIPPWQSTFTNSLLTYKDTEDDS